MRIRRNKKQISMWISALFVLGLILSGIHYATKFKESGIKAEELNLTITSSQQEFYENDVFQFDITINDSLSNREFYLEVPQEFKLNTADILQANQGVIEKIEPVGLKQKITLANDGNAPTKINISGNLTVAGDFKVKVTDETGLEKQFPLAVKAHPSIETLIDPEEKEESEPNTAAPETPIEQPKAEELAPPVAEIPVENEKLMESISPRNAIQPRLNLLPAGTLLVNEPGVIKIPKLNPPQTISGEYGLVLSRFKESKVNYFVHGVNKGTPKALQRFTRAQSGEDTYIYYTKTGIYKGRVIDVKEVIVNTASGGSSFGTATPTAGGTSNMLSARVEGGSQYNPATIRVEFYDSETGERVKVKGVWNLTDIDFNETAIMYSDSIQEVYVREDSDVLGQLRNNQLTVESPRNSNVSETDETRWVSIAYGETDELTFDYYSSNSWNGYDVKSLVPIAFPDPSKIGTVEDQVTKKVNYKTYVSVPYRQIKNFEPQLIIEDPIIDELSVQSFNIIDTLTGQNVNNLFTLSQQGNNIRAEAKDASLKRADFYNKMYMLEVVATVKDGADLSKYPYENGYRLLPNTSQIIVTNSDASDKIVKSNEAFAKLKDERLEVKEEVFHLDGSVADIATPGEQLTYRGTALSAYPSETETINYATLSFATTVDEQLEAITNITLKDETGQVVGTGSYDAGTRKITASITKPVNRKQAVYLEYNGTVKKGVPTGTLVKGKTTVEGKYSNGFEIPLSYSNEVTTLIEDYGVLEESVTHQDGSVADDAQVNDILHYKIIYRTPYKQADTKYTTISINSDITELTNYTKDSTNLVAHTESGKPLAVPTIVGTTLSLNDSSGTIAANETIIVEFDVTVDAGKVSDGTVIKNSATAAMTFSDNFKTVGLQSNLVETRIKGVLEFISAPKELNFGNDLKISTKDQVYPIQNKDEGLIVQDSRGEGNQWSMKATLLKELTSESGHQLIDSLHYYNQGKELAFTVGDSIPIRDQKTADNQPVEISNDWQDVQAGPVLKVKAGQPYNEKYMGAIQWTLQSVPGNE